jgi:predicted  nucleic acid-binding Zn-ribbon protein
LSRFADIKKLNQKIDEIEKEKMTLKKQLSSATSEFERQAFLQQIATVQQQVVVLQQQLPFLREKEIFLLKQSALTSLGVRFFCYFL